MRWLGHRLQAEVRMTVDRDLDVASAHVIGDRVEAALMAELPLLSGAIVHVNPATTTSGTSRTRSQPNTIPITDQKAAAPATVASRNCQMRVAGASTGSGLDGRTARPTTASADPDRHRGRSGVVHRHAAGRAAPATPASRPGRHQRPGHGHEVEGGALPMVSGSPTAGGLAGYFRNGRRNTPTKPAAASATAARQSSGGPQAVADARRRPR